MPCVVEQPRAECGVDELLRSSPHMAACRVDPLSPPRVALFFCAPAVATEWSTQRAFADLFSDVVSPCAPDCGRLVVCSHRRIPGGDLGVIRPRYRLGGPEWAVSHRACHASHTWLGHVARHPGPRDMSWCDAMQCSAGQPGCTTKCLRHPHKT